MDPNSHSVLLWEMIFIVIFNLLRSCKILNTSYSELYRVKKFLI